MSLSSVLAHDGGGDRIVATDADAENETKANEPPNIGGEKAQAIAPAARTSTSTP
jgi:hypothetical protein